ncbi:MAG: hypothetical protein AAGD96_19680 [Chloroflexota bacterium]
MPETIFEYSHKKTKSVDHFIDPHTELAVVSFSGVVTPDSIGLVYEWGIKDLIPYLRSQEPRGIIFDYTNVERFGFGTLGEAVRANSEIKRLFQAESANFDEIPIIHITMSTRQETAIRMLLMGVVSKRRWVARSREEALNLINACNEKHGRLFDLSKDVLTVWPA